ncbi:hypothetical protein G9A89_018865 [Geosiphon pyriformis]|nr:hypothetical protein G9A89_018865 [Geosiphon pyriformis]
MQKQKKLLSKFDSFSGIWDEREKKYDKTKLFFDFETTIDPSIAVIKKIAKKSDSGGGFKPVLSRKKRKSVTLEEGIGGRRILTKASGGCSWSSETGDTTESESINMEEKCLIEKTSFDYSKSGIITDKNHDQTPKKPGVKIKKTLDKLLGKINFLNLDIDNNILSNALLELPSSLKNLVPISVRKSFALNISLNKVASTLSKFSGIIYASFTSKASLVQAIKKTRAADILVNTNLKKLNTRSDWTMVVKKIPVETSAEAKAIVEFEQSDHADLVAAKWSILIGKNAMYVARANLDKKTWNVRDHHRALLYTLPMETNVHDIWDFVRSVSGKTCVINCYPVIYA